MADLRYVTDIKTNVNTDEWSDWTAANGGTIAGALANKGLWEAAPFKGIFEYNVPLTGSALGAVNANIRYRIY